MTSPTIQVTQVFLDEPGGGASHIRMLKEELPDRVKTREIPTRPEDLGRSPRRWLSSVRKVRSNSVDSHLIHAHGVRAAALVALSRPKAPVVVTIHGLHSVRRNRGLGGRIVRLINRMVLARASEILVLSESDASLVAELGGRPLRISAGFRPPPRMEQESARRKLAIDKSNIVLWVGRFSREKDPFSFVQAMKVLPDATGLMVGGGDLDSEVDAFIEAQGLQLRIIRTGWLNEPSVAYAAADVFVSTSTWEGLPIAAMEAASVGLPLVLTACPGNVDLVSDGVPARLAPVGAPDEIAENVRALLEDATAIREGELVRSAVLSRYGADRLREEVLSVYDRLTARTEPTRSA